MSKSAIEEMQGAEVEAAKVIAEAQSKSAESVE